MSVQADAAKAFAVLMRLEAKRVGLEDALLVTAAISLIASTIDEAATDDRQWERMVNTVIKGIRTYPRESRAVAN